MALPEPINQPQVELEEGMQRTELWAREKGLI